MSDQTSSVRSYNVLSESHLILNGFGYCLSLPPDAARGNGRTAAEKTNSFELFVTLFKLQIVSPCSPVVTLSKLQIVKGFLNTATAKIYISIYMYILYI